MSPSGEGNGNPLQYSCLENPMDGGACRRGLVHGVARSRTWLKWLSSSSSSRSVPKIHSCCSIWQDFLLFKAWIILHNKYTHFLYPFICQWTLILSNSVTSWILWIVLQWTWVCKYLLKILSSILLGTYNKIVRLYGNSIFNFLRNLSTVFPSSHIILHSQWVCKVSRLSAFLLAFVIFWVFCWVRSLGWEDPLQKETAIHSSTIAWKIPWTEEPGRLQSGVAKNWTWLSLFFVFLIVAILLDVRWLLNSAC